MTTAGAGGWAIGRARWSGPALAAWALSLATALGAPLPDATHIEQPVAPALMVASPDWRNPEYVPAGTISRQLLIQNLLPTEVRGLKAELTCRCGQATFPFDRIEGEGTLPLDVSFSVGGNGPVRKEVVITTTDPPSRLVVPVDFILVSTAVVEPAAGVFAVERKGEPGADVGKFRVLINTTRVEQITPAWASGDELFAAHMLPGEERWKGVRECDLLLTRNAPLLEKDVHAYIQLLLSLDQGHTAVESVPVTVRVISASGLDIANRFVDVGRVQSGSKVSLALAVRRSPCPLGLLRSSDEAAPATTTQKDERNTAGIVTLSFTTPEIQAGIAPMHRILGLKTPSGAVEQVTVVGVVCGRNP